MAETKVEKTWQEREEQIDAESLAKARLAAEAHQPCRCWECINKRVETNRRRRPIDQLWGEDFAVHPYTSLNGQIEDGACIAEDCGVQELAPFLLQSGLCLSIACTREEAPNLAMILQREAGVPLEAVWHEGSGEALYVRAKDWEDKGDGTTTELSEGIRGAGRKKKRRANRTGKARP